MSDTSHAIPDTPGSDAAGSVGSVGSVGSSTDAHLEPATTVQRAAVEAFGTLVLVLVGCGAAVFSSVDSGVDFLAIALAFGLALAVVVHAFGRISGGHFNPAVSVGAAISGRISWAQAGVYAGAQVVGAVVGTALLFVSVKALPDASVSDEFLGQNFFGDGGFAWWGALLAELVLTAILVTIYLAVTDERNTTVGAAPLTIGLSLTALYLFTLPLTGGSLNPARSIGPALFTGVDAIEDLWLFVLAPLLAAAGAGLLYPVLFGHGSEPVPGSGLNLSRPPRPASAAPGYGGYPPQGQGYPQQGYPSGYDSQGQPAQGYPAQGYGQQGYAGSAHGGQSSWDQGTQTAPVAQQPVYEPEPIIQDGWQWDHQAQEWKPLEQWPAPAHAATPEPTPGAPLGPDPASTDVRPEDHRSPDVSQEPWPGDDQTVIRPRQQP